MPKLYQLPTSLENWIQQTLKSLGFPLTKPQTLAQAVLEVSDNFQSTDSVTPWRQPRHMAAYISYFLPLNYIRSLKVIDETCDWSFFEDVDRVIDFGCGPGTLTRALLDESRVSATHFLGVDSESSLRDLYLNQPRKEVQLEFSTHLSQSSSSKTLFVGSYVLNELKTLPATLFEHDKIMILEPSTRQAFPKLLELRDTLIEHDYEILAPCSHREQCPLALSKKDWCHDRVHWNQPSWFEDLENLLPMKNKTLSFSYLLAVRKNSSVEKTFWRVIGDPLIEKGKTRWLICKNSDRVFLSHLKRQGPAPNLQRGDKIWLDDYEQKGNELRYQSLQWDNQ